MPCRSDGYEQYKYEEATRVACELADHIERNSKVTLLDIKSISAETRTWVQAHRELDRQRSLVEAKEAKKQKIKEKALTKLTKEEKDALNL